LARHRSLKSGIWVGLLLGREVVGVVVGMEVEGAMLGCGRVGYQFGIVELEILPRKSSQKSDTRKVI
jgi:hypothetical protein